MIVEIEIQANRVDNLAGHVTDRQVRAELQDAALQLRRVVASRSEMPPDHLKTAAALIHFGESRDHDIDS